MQVHIGRPGRSAVVPSKAKAALLSPDLMKARLPSHIGLAVRAYDKFRSCEAAVDRDSLVGQPHMFGAPRNLTLHSSARFTRSS